MEFKPSRTSRPAQRAASQQSSVRDDSVEMTPEPAAVKPQATYRPRPHHKQEKKRFFKRPAFLVGLVVLAVLAMGAWFLLSSQKNAATAIDSSRYQAVFLANGQVYFGKLHPFNATAMKMTDVYYLQATEDDAAADPENPQQTSSASKNVELIKLGDEIHGPEDEMIILLNQVTFYENLKPNSKIAESIERHKQKN